jgi:hypothetical protein
MIISFVRQETVEELERDDRIVLQPKTMRKMARPSVAGRGAAVRSDFSEALQAGLRSGLT